MEIESQDLSTGNMLLHSISRMVAEVQKKYPQLDYFNAGRLAMGVGTLPFRFDKIQSNQDDEDLGLYA